MPSELTVDSIRWAAGRLAERMRGAADELNTLDGTLGDGDLGVTLVRGTERMSAGITELPGDVGLALAQCGLAFTKVSASTYGTLLATGLMAAGKQTRGRTAIPWSEVSSLLAAAVRAMAERGKSGFGDKTVLDAIEAARQATQGLDDPAALASAAAAAAGVALDRFREQPFRQGRARIFGAKGIGCDDPGMVAFLRIVESLEDSNQEK
jgi:phosphoenolpyruvate---glycerone phosphotransferase subunit DhaL